MQKNVKGEKNLKNNEVKQRPVVKSFKIATMFAFD